MTVRCIRTLPVYDEWWCLSPEPIRPLTLSYRSLSKPLLSSFRPLIIWAEPPRSTTEPANEHTNLSSSAPFITCPLTTVPVAATHALPLLLRLPLLSTTGTQAISLVLVVYKAGL